MCFKSSQMSDATGHSSHGGRVGDEAVSSRKEKRREDAKGRGGWSID